MNIVVVLFLISFIGSEAAGEGCIDYFTGSFEDYGSLLISKSETSESTAVGTVIVTIGYNPEFLDEPEEIDDTYTEDGLKYLDGVDDGSNIVVSVKQNMIGLPDFPESVVRLQIQYDFPVLADNSEYEEICTLQIRVDLQDGNTQIPTTDKDSYIYTVREDYPEMLTIPNFQILASDLDYSVPNNQLTVTFKESDCPLESDEQTYTPVQGGNVSVTFHLKNKVDYDSMGSTHDITCSGAATDGGSTQLKKEFFLILTVEPFSDEFPRFEYPLYSTELDNLEATGLPLPISPAEIKATDGDNDVIEYSMEAYEDSAPWNDFFAIDSSTGEVFQVKDLPSDMAEFVHIFYIVKASDGTSPTDSSSDTAVLQIILPKREITTTTQTQCETCEPCPTCNTASFITDTIRN